MTTTDAKPGAASKPAKHVGVRVCANALVDEAHIDGRCFTKHAPTLVAAKDAKRLLSGHSYLEATEGQHER
jgi:hypothetical protein